MFTSSLFISLSIPARVVDLPEPVGPVIRILPKGLSMALFITSADLPSNPNSDNSTLPVSGSKIRITTFSPFFVGKVETRKSILRLPSFVENLPSWASRVSSIFKSDKIFMRVIMADWRVLGRVRVVVRIPSILKRVLTLSSNGSI